MDSRISGEEERVENIVKEKAAHALDYFENTQDEVESARLEQETVDAAKHAVEVLNDEIASEGGVPTPQEKHELKDMEKVIEVETKAQEFAKKNDLFFEDRQVIKGEEAAADGEERADEEHAYYEVKES